MAFSSCQNVLGNVHVCGPRLSRSLDMVAGEADFKGRNSKAQYLAIQLRSD
jgi:hypothetical protein